MCSVIPSVTGEHIMHHAACDKAMSDCTCSEGQHNTHIYKAEGHQNIHVRKAKGRASKPLCMQR